MNARIRLFLLLLCGFLGGLGSGCAEAPKVQTVPGGGLAAHERAGGHLIDRHVGKSEADLVRRLQEERRIRSASSFPDLPTAEVVVGVVIASRGAEISRWLKGRDPRLALDFTANRPVGIVVSRRTMKAEPARSVRLILERDPAFLPLGWRILTGYPQS